MNSVAYYW